MWTRCCTWRATARRWPLCCVRGGQLASATGLSQDDVKGHDVTVHTIMAAPGPKTLTSLAEQVASGALRVPVMATYPLEQAAEAFAAFSSGTPGKITVSCS
ncbi:zinc-binding dehydrogenase [Streptomyces caniscabiei]|uniref:zinc-binding dehydrogenase n=1 Tax=Streptomyces caniscabiei TaxID=2746961 RepID=UPI0029AF48CE|nr:zinc-binding dehydrogenase [Streptomyces caniscabiei]MDX2604255.1 zinc-binding dehydrogenase [Streptomyces caniscabiei]MDX2735597.1 zinc-binding dehydrogenase [Streptomyces caniscabiei]MDX2777000.1 zinc-binding dehydrogenase [Streptomyces caniscabiei]